MSLHDFDFSEFNVGQEELQSYVSQPREQINNVGIEKRASIDDLGDPGNRPNDPRDDVDEDFRFIEDPIDINYVEEVRESFVPGFKLMDKGIKNYFSGIRIPVGNGLEEYRIMPVRISGADPEALIYSDKNLRGARLELPIMAIHRSGCRFDPNRYSPPILPIARYFKNCTKRSELIYRPVPFKLDYSMYVWAEHKSDAEYAMFSVISRLNPIGSYFVEEQGLGLSQEVILHPGSNTDESDIESNNDTRAQVKLTMTVEMEGWLPISSKIVPNILAKPVTIKEGVGGKQDEILLPGETLEAYRDTSSF
jgi:hypothetical protein